MDGFASSWAAWHKFKDDAEYIAVSDRKNFPEQILNLQNKKDIELYVLDFSYSKEILLNAEKEFKKFVIIDHHITAKDDVKSCANHVYSEDKSGAYLAYEYFHKDKEIPLIIKYVSEGDLYKFSLPNCKEVLNYIHNPSTKEGYEYFDYKKDQIENNIEEVVKMGEILQDSRDKRVQNLLATKFKIKFDGYDVWAVNGNREFRGEVGNELAKLTNTFGVYFYITENNLRISLRSVPDFDVSVIAKKYGHGGHKNASGIEIEIDVQKLFEVFNK